MSITKEVRPDGDQQAGLANPDNQEELDRQLIIDIATQAARALCDSCGIEVQRRRVADPESIDAMNLLAAQRTADIAARDALKNLTYAVAGKGSRLQSPSIPFRSRQFSDDSMCGILQNSVYVVGERIDMSGGVAVLMIPSMGASVNGVQLPDEHVPFVTLQQMTGHSMTIALDIPPETESCYPYFEVLGSTGRSDLRDTVTALRDVTYGSTD